MVANAAATLVRFLLLRGWVFGSARSAAASGRDAAGS